MLTLWLWLWLLQNPLVVSLPVPLNSFQNMAQIVDDKLKPLLHFAPFQIFKPHLGFAYDFVLI